MPDLEEEEVWESASSSGLEAHGKRGRELNAGKKVNDRKEVLSNSFTYN